MKLDEKDIKKIAVFRALQLGDMLCAIPAIRALRNAYPNAEITLLGLPWAKSFIERFNNYFNRFIHFPGYTGLPEQPYDEAEFTAFSRQIKNENFDLLLQMQGNGTIVNDLLLGLNAKFVAGFYNNESYVDDELFIPYPDYGSEILRHLKLVEHLGIPSCGTYLEFPIEPTDVQEAKNLYQLLFEKRYVIIHPGSRGAWRQWPPQFFAALGDHCIESGFSIVVTGTSEEREITRELIKCMHHPVIDLTGKTSLGSVAALIENAFLLLANCTGVSHIAAALKTPSVIVSMDGEPERWSPLDSALHHVIDCSRQPNFNKVYQETVRLVKRKHNIQKQFNG